MSKRTEITRLPTRPKSVSHVVAVNRIAVSKKAASRWTNLILWSKMRCLAFYKKALASAILSTQKATRGIPSKHGIGQPGLGSSGVSTKARRVRKPSQQLRLISVPRGMKSTLALADWPLLSPFRSCAAVAPLAWYALDQSDPPAGSAACICSG